MKTLDVVIPVLNEQQDLPPSIARLYEFMSDHMDEYDWQIVIADNGSTDMTQEVSNKLVRDMTRIGYVRLEERGRGRALKQTWLDSKADVVSYMDVDLSTDLTAFPRLINAIVNEGFGVAIGSRLIKDSNVIGRGLKREVASRGYSTLFRSMFFTGFRDAQCGFKAFSRSAADDILPLVQNTGWFFDTELLIIAEKNGYRIKELPVRWVEDPDTRVNITGTAYEDVKGLLRMRFGGLRKASKAIRRKGKS